jgi:hypothetical protein
MLKGWSIPLHMEWLFWPIGYVPAEFSVDVVSRPGEVVEFTRSVCLSIEGLPTSIGRRFKVVTPEWNEIVDKGARRP